MSEEGEKKAVFPSPTPFGRPELPEDRRWPSPIQLPAVPTDVGKLFKEILDRLDAIEKRLERMERLLVAIQRPR
jgi:hypothetical protein